MEMTTAPTRLELDLLARFHARYEQYGFPSPAILRVRSRQDSSAGRFTYLEHEGSISRYDGQLGLGRYSQFEMAGVKAGFSFWVQLKNGKVDYLEFVVNGEEEWDGSESSWTVRDPETGELPPKQSDL
jgi:hypothetical protein